MTDLDMVLNEPDDDVAKAEAAIMEISEEVDDWGGDEQAAAPEEAAPEAEAEAEPESLEDRLARIERENEELRRHEAGLRSNLIENRQKAAAYQQERDALFESLSNIDKRLQERAAAAPEAASGGWFEEDSADKSVRADDETAETLKEIKARLEREDAEKQVRSTISQVIDQTVRAEAEFKNQNPDVPYDDAIQFAENYHLRQMLASGVPEPTARQQLQQAKLEAAYNVISTGQSPAVAALNYARSLGWDPGGAAQQQMPQRARPPKTIANAGRAPAKSNPNSLATLYKTDPKKFRRIAADPEAWLELEKRIAQQEGIPQGPA